MCFVPRVTLPSARGPIEFLLYDDPRFATSEFLTPDDVNRDNVVLLRVCWMSLLADSPFDTAKPVSVLRAFCAKLYDTRRTIAEFSALGDQVMKSEQIKEDGSVIRTYIPALKETPIYREYFYWLRTGDTRALQYILSFLKYGKKLAYVDDSLNSAALRGWYETECRLRNLELPLFAQNLKIVCHWLYADYSIGDVGIYPAHGGGAVSERRIKGVHLKNQNLRFTPQQWKLYFERSSLTVDPDGTLHFVVNATETGDLGLPDFQGYYDLSLDQMARLTFVPKDFKKSRSICMEPDGFMFLQQGILLTLEGYLKTSRVRNFIDLEHQESNQLAAQFGSWTGLVDTLDLTSASDSVLWALIMLIMPNSLLRHLASTRSDKVLLSDGLYVEVSKFAPMGSALCFPIQCMVFAATIITVALIQALGRKLDDPTALEGVDLDELMSYSFGEFGSTEGGRFQPPQVYGDDLCLDKRLTSNTIAALESLGFTVNREKSFTGEDTFRESCGKYYSRGHDVSFLLHSVKSLDVESASIATLGSVIDLANRAGDFGYRTLRRSLINFALRHQFPGVKSRKGINPVLFTEDRNETFAIFVGKDRARNSHLRLRKYTSESARLLDFGKSEVKIAWVMRDTLHNQPDQHFEWNKVVQPPLPSHILYQRDEVQSISSKPGRASKWDWSDENYAHTIWWRAQRRRGDDLRITQALSRADRLGTVATMRWTRT